MYVLEIPILNYYFYLTQRHNPWVREQIDMRKNIVKTLKNAALQTIYISGFSEVTRECVRAGAAGSRTRRSSGHHVLNPQNFE